MGFRIPRILMISIGSAVIPLIGILFVLLWGGQESLDPLPILRDNFLTEESGEKYLQAETGEKYSLHEPDGRFLVDATGTGYRLVPSGGKYVKGASGEKYMIAPIVTEWTTGTTTIILVGLSIIIAAVLGFLFAAWAKKPDRYGTETTRRFLDSNYHN